MQTAAAATIVLAMAIGAHAQTAEVACLTASGDAGTRCLARYTTAVERCRSRGDAVCEEGALAEGGSVEAILSATEPSTRRGCSDEVAEGLGYLGDGDVLVRVREACGDFAGDLLDLGYADDLSSLSRQARRCQLIVARSLRRLRSRVIRLVGGACIVPNFAGEGCDLERRDRLLLEARTRARLDIESRCGVEFDALQLSTAGATLGERIDDVVGGVIDHSRHFAQLVYPPNDLGPTADFGPFPIGIRTLALTDSSRNAVGGTGPRPVTTEVFYPSTQESVAGRSRDVARVLGFDIVETPAYRDVALAPGPFPLVLFSHGNNGIRIQSFFFAAHLASHGFIVVSPDHHGNTFVDTLDGVIDPQVAGNRPRDLSFLIDQFLAFNDQPGDFFAGAIDPARIAASGHSFGGLTSFLLAGPGEFIDTRIKAILPQAPAAPFTAEFFAGVTIPTLILGGSIDETTPFATQQLRPYENLPVGAQVVAVAEIVGAGHFTFSDFCEVPRLVLSFLGGFDEACEPRHLPWRHAHDIVNYLSLNFFDAVLNGNAAARERLSAQSVAPIEDLVLQSK